MIVAVYVKTNGSPEKAIEEMSLPSGWEVRSFIDTAKLFTARVTGVPTSKFDDSNLMNAYLGPEWSYIREERFVRGGEVDRKPVTYYLSPKTILSKMYELGREIHSNFWVNALLNEYDPRTSNWIVFMMYPNEFAAVKDLKADTIFYELSSAKGMLDSIKSQFDVIVKSQQEFEKTLLEKIGK
jgi:hypothetical protein